jgi:MFS family permease
LGFAIAIAAGGSLSGIVVTAINAIRHHPQPWRTVFAFVMLPGYAGWRFVVALRTLFTLGDTTWRRTGRADTRVSGVVPLAGPRV